MESVLEISRQLDLVVGSEAGGVQFDVRSALGSMLPRPEDFESSRANPAYIERKYEELERFLLDDSPFSEIHVWIIGGLKFDSPRVELGDGAYLDKLTDSELAQAWEFDLVSPKLSKEFPFTPDLYDPLRTCIRAVRPLRRLIGEEVGTSKPDRTEDLQRLEERIRQTLVLSGLYEAAPTGHIVWATGALHQGSLRYEKLGSPTGLPFPTSSADPRILSIQRCWGLLSQVLPSKRGRALDLAIRRLSYLIDRARPDDRLLDLMIAAEAFYLAKIGNEKTRGELSYRLALRAALWAAVLGASAEEVRKRYKLLRDAYDARSLVAHGEDFEKHMAKERTSTKEFIDDLVNLIRGDVIGALRKISTGELSKWPPDWDEEMFSRISQVK
jgi:hypothetical protein